MISYDPNPLGIKFKVLDGVTSNLAMHGGTENAEEWYKEWYDYGVTTNFGASSFITRMRWPIAGEGVDDEITEKEDIDKLVNLVKKNIEDGAIGISFSFEYVPGIKNEIIPLLNLAKEYNVPTFYHLRYSDKDNGPKGIEEVIDYAKKTQASIHIMHINSTGGTFNMKKALDLIDNGIKDGLDITACIYPYDYWATYIDSARFREGWQERYNINYNDLQIGGTNIRISENTFEKYRTQRLLVAAHNSIPEEDNILALKHPSIMIGSDTIIESGGNNHPRGSGTYGRLFNKYVVKDKILTTMEAIEKVSYLPARRMEEIAPKMKYKGRIEIDADADLAIFDLENFKDNSTVEETEIPSTGMEYVIINGTIVKDKDGYIENLHPGEQIKSKFIDEFEKRDNIIYNLKYNNEEYILNKSYNIDNKPYINLKEIFDLLKLNYSIDKNGNININDILNLKVGDIKYNYDSKELSLKDEIIIYESDFYISLDTFLQVFEEYYDIEIDNENINIKNNSLSKKLIDNNNKDKNNNKSTTEDKSNKSSTKIFILIPIFFILIFLYHIYKKQNK